MIACRCALGLRAALLSGVRRYSRAAYEGEGKTTVNVLNNNIELGIMIDAYSTLGFRLNNGVTIVGPMVLFPRIIPKIYAVGLLLTHIAPTFTAKRSALKPIFTIQLTKTVLSWQVKTSLDVTEDSLRLFTLLEPKIDLLIISVEAKNKALTEPVLLAAKKLNLNVELLDTQHACATFNFLAVEGRSVAAAMIPPMQVDFSEDDVLDHRIHYDNIFNKDVWDTTTTRKDS